MTQLFYVEKYKLKPVYLLIVTALVSIMKTQTEKKNYPALSVSEAYNVPQVYSVFVLKVDNWKHKCCLDLFCRSAHKHSLQVQQEHKMHITLY